MPTGGRPSQSGVRCSSSLHPMLLPPREPSRWTSRLLPAAASLLSGRRGGSCIALRRSSSMSARSAASHAARSASVANSPAARLNCRLRARSARLCVEPTAGDDRAAAAGDEAVGLAGSGGGEGAGGRGAAAGASAASSSSCWAPLGSAAGSWAAGAVVTAATQWLLPPPQMLKSSLYAWLGALGGCSSAGGAGAASAQSWPSTAGRNCGAACSSSTAATGAGSKSGEVCRHCSPAPQPAVALPVAGSPGCCSAAAAPVLPLHAAGLPPVSGRRCSGELPPATVAGRLSETSQAPRLLLLRCCSSAASSA